PQAGAGAMIHSGDRRWRPSARLRWSRRSDIGAPPPRLPHRRRRRPAPTAFPPLLARPQAVRRATGQESASEGLAENIEAATVSSPEAARKCPRTCIRLSGQKILYPVLNVNLYAVPSESSIVAGICGKNPCIADISASPGAI